MKHFISFLAHHGGHILLVIFVAGMVVSFFYVVYLVIRTQQEKREFRQMVALFRVTVPTDAGPVELRYPHIELLSELVQPRSEEYFSLRKSEWDSRLDGDLTDAIALFTQAHLIRKSRSIEGGAVLSVKGAALVAEHGRDSYARRAAASRVRKRRSKKQYPNEKHLA